MCILTKSVRLLEDFFRAHPQWYIALHDTKYHALNDVANNPLLWIDIFTFRFNYPPDGVESPLWDTLLESERMSAALRVVEHRLNKL